MNRMQGDTGCFLPQGEARVEEIKYERFKSYHNHWFYNVYHVVTISVKELFFKLETINFVKSHTLRIWLAEISRTNPQSLAFTGMVKYYLTFNWN